MVSYIDLSYFIDRFYCIKPAFGCRLVRVVSQSKDQVRFLCNNIIYGIFRIRIATPIACRYDIGSLLGIEPVWRELFTILADNTHIVNKAKTGARNILIASVITIRSLLFVCVFVTIIQKK